MSANTAKASSSKSAVNVQIDSDKIITEALKMSDKTGEITANLALLVIREDGMTYSSLDSALNLSGPAFTKFCDNLLARYSVHYKAKLDSLPKLQEDKKNAAEKKNAEKVLQIGWEIEDLLKAMRSVRLLMKTALQIARVFRGQQYVKAELIKKRLVFTASDGATATASANEWSRAPKTERERLEREAEKKAKAEGKTSEGKTADTAKQPPAIAQQIDATIKTLDLLMSAKTEDGKPAPISAEIRNELDVLFAKLAVFYGKDGKPDMKTAERKIDATLAKLRNPGLSAQDKANQHPEAKKA